MHDVVVGIKALYEGTPASTGEHLQLLHLLTIRTRLSETMVSGRPPGADGVGGGSTPSEDVELLGDGGVGGQRLIKE
jgi:hypothetical protein